MPLLAFRILNVFALAPEGRQSHRLTGNPLCVFEDGRGLDDATLGALARQFNLSETTFVLPSERATAAFRIFTPDFEMPFAGHPTLGTAHVVRQLGGAGDEITLEARAGVIPVRARGAEWTLTAGAASERAASARREALAAMLGIAPVDVGEGAAFVNTGSEQLLVPLTSAEAVRRCRPVAGLLEQHAAPADGVYKVLAFFDEGAGGSGGGAAEVTARFFFPKAGAVLEDPATGSACANLGGWLARRAALPLDRTVRQGDQLGRPSRLGLRVEEDGRSQVTGRVVELARGTLEL